MCGLPPWTAGCGRLWVFGAAFEAVPFQCAQGAGVAGPVRPRALEGGMVKVPMGEGRTQACGQGPASSSAGLTRQ